jgi:hypothetical protein
MNFNDGKQTTSVLCLLHLTCSQSWFLSPEVFQRTKQYKLCKWENILKCLQNQYNPMHKINGINSNDVIGCMNSRNLKYESFIEKKRTQI